MILGFFAMLLSNLAYIYKGHIRSSMKIIFISSIGLIFALGIIASTLVYVNSTQSLVYTQYIQQNSSPAYYNNYYYSNAFTNYNPQSNDYNLQFSFYNPNDNLESIKSSLNETIMHRINTLGLESKISSVKLTAHTDGATLLLNTSIPNYGSGSYVATTAYKNNSISIYGITNDLRPELEKLNSKIGFGTLPQQRNNTEAYLLSSYNYIFQNQKKIYPDINNITNMYIDYHLTNGSFNSLKYPLNISGFAKFQSLDYNIYPHLIDILSLQYDPILFVNNLTNFFHMLNIPLNNISNFSSPPFTEVVSGIISINYSILSIYNANDDLNTFNRLQFQLQDDFSSLANNLHLSNYYAYVNFFSGGIFQSAASISSGILTMLLLYAFPIILVSLFVANYSFGLIHRNVLRHIGTYKTRGATDTLILLMQLIDLGFTIIIAIGGGLVLGIPIGNLILHTDSFLSFNGLSNAVLTFDLGNLLQALAIYGLILGFLIQILRIIRLSKVTIAETENPTEKTDPFWERHYLDVFLFFGGGLGFVIFYIAITQQWFFLGPFLLLGLPTPLMVTIGTILFFSRMFPIVLNRLSSVFWQYKGGHFSFAMKNVIRHKQASTRAVMLIGVLLAFLITFLAIPFSYNTWNQNKLAYDLGAEGVATLPSITNTEFYNNTLIKILETNYSQYFQGITPFLKLNAQIYTGNTVGTISYGGNVFLAINTSTYLSAADIPVDLNTRNTLKTDMQLLGQNSSITNIIIQEKVLQFYSTTNGGTFTLLDNFHNSYHFKIIDTFSRWPNLFDEYNYYYTGQSIFGVINIAPFLNNNFTFENSLYSLASSGIYFNFKDGVNQTLVAQILKTNLSLSVTLLSQQIYSSTHQITNLVMIGQINANIIISILIGGALLLMFAWLQLIERRKEIFTERALGMKIHQIFFLFLIESLVLLASGIVIGLLMGGGLSEMLTLFITFGPTVVPYVTYYPLDLIAESLLILIILAIVGTIIPAIIVTRLDISHSFAGER